MAEKNRDSRKRVALVIGNSSYLSSPLKNPANDAHVMAASLRRLGFEVEEKTNLSYLEMNKAVESFGKKLRSGGVGMFYYAGHGMQVGGANYLIPVDAQIEDENEVRFKAVDAGLVLAKMEQAKSDVNLVVLDACRDNPFSRSFRSASHGLASIDAPNGTFIAYATAPGKTAADGDGKNGLYTSELVKVLETPGIPLEQVFKRTLKAVREKSGSKQTPWVASNLEGEFYFIQPSSMTERPTLSPPTRADEMHEDTIAKASNPQAGSNHNGNRDHDILLLAKTMHEEVISGIKATFKIVKKSNANLIAVEFKEYNNDHIVAEGEVIVKVLAPDKSEQTKSLYRMQGYFGSEFDMAAAGKYGVMCKFKLADGNVRSSRFWYTIK